jgi:hypothetical protein
VILVAALGLTPQVTQWDSLILSESASLSLLAISFGVGVRYAVRPSASLAACLVASLGTWALTRHINLLVLLVVSAVTLVIALVRRSRSAMGVSAALVSVGLIGLLGLSGASGIWHDNANAILANRILASRDGTDYFVREGLPGPTPDMLAWVGRFRSDAPQLQDAALQSWIGSRWTETYGRYLASHPREAVVEPLWRFPKLWASHLHYAQRKTELAAGESRFSAIEGVFLFALFAAAGVLAVIRRKRHHVDTSEVVVAVGLCSAVVASYMTWHLSATELERLMLPWALVVRLVLVLYILVAVDTTLLRSGPPTDVSSPSASPSAAGRQPEDGCRPDAARAQASRPIFAVSLMSATSAFSSRSASFLNRTQALPILAFGSRSTYRLAT